MTKAPTELELYASELVAYAEETHRLALELWHYVFPPWRWPEWFRRRAEIERRRQVVALALADLRAGNVRPGR